VKQRILTYAVFSYAYYTYNMVELWIEQRTASIKLTESMSPTKKKKTATPTCGK